MASSPTTYPTGIAINVTAAIDYSISKNKKHPGSLSGRLFVVPFVLVLVVLGFLMFAVAARFQTIMSQLEESRSLWPTASQELGLRYDRLNDLFEDVSVADAVKQNWISNQREFNASSQFDRQSIASQLIENRIRQSLDEFQRMVTDFEKPGIQKLREVEVRRKKSQEGILGWLTVQGLRLKLPPIYDPIANNN